jgi:hypothetical protein
VPSPLGHALGAIAAGWLVGGRLGAGWHATGFLPSKAGAPRTVEVRGAAAMTAVFAVVGVVPDLDLLVPDAHSTYTHSLGAVALAFVATLAIARRLLPARPVNSALRSPRFAAAVAAAWASHLLLDWLGSDTRAPIGIMALWPFTGDHYQSSVQVFDAISRRYWMPEQFVWGNLKAAAREVAILAPIAWIAYRLTNTRVTRDDTQGTKEGQG